MKIWQKGIKRCQARRECFWRKYPEIFNDSSENEVDEGKTRPNKPNLAKIRKMLLCNRTAEAFTDYHGVESDPNLTLVEKIIKLQKVIGDANLRKTHYVSLLGELLQSCFNESKKAYKKVLEQAKIKRWWTLFLRKLHKPTFCTVSLHFVHYNFKEIEEICTSEPDNWK